MSSVLNYLLSSYYLDLLIRTFLKSLGLSKCGGVFVFWLGLVLDFVVWGFCCCLLFSNLLFLLSELIFDC